MIPDGTLWRNVLPALLGNLVGHGLVTALVVSVLGLARRWQGQAPSFRTMLGIALGACAVLVITRQGLPGLGLAAPGALLGGVIVLSSWVVGLHLVAQRAPQPQAMEHAATLWVSSALGFAVGAGQIALAVAAAVVITAGFGLEHVIAAWRGQHQFTNPDPPHPDSP